MRAVLFTLLLLATYASAQSPRQSAPARQPELYEQGNGAMGLWFDGYTVGVIGWRGIPVPMGAQVVLKGRNFVGRNVVVLLRYSRFSDLGEVVYLLPKLDYDLYPPTMESCGFFLPPFVYGPVQATLIVEGRTSNTVVFTVL